MKVEIVAENLREIKEIFDKIGIDYWLDLGTLLGAVRDGKIIEWDTDVDLGTWYDNVKQIISTFPEFKKRGFYIEVNRKTGFVATRRSGCSVDIHSYRKRSDYAWEVWIAEKRRIDKILSSYAYILTRGKHAKPERVFTRKSEPFFSLLPLTLKQLLGDIMWSVLEKLGCITPIVVPKRYFEELSTMQFYGMQFNAPFDVEKYLEYRYGKNWKTPTKKWTYYRDDGAINPNWSHACKMEHVT